MCLNNVSVKVCVGCPRTARDCVKTSLSQEPITPEGGRGGTPIHYLYGYVPPKGVVILKLLI